jgi:endonuclease/exonuclease/phosphatase family metal-dependent hydrolase
MGRRGWTVIVAVTALVATGALAACGSDDETELTAMSFNIWGGGANENKPVDETVAAIEAADADVIGVQETRLEGPKCTAEYCPARGPSVAQELADALGYNVYEQKTENEALWANAILSRYPIKGATPNDLGVELDVDGRSVYAFNIHLDDAPYQPYQLLDIKYGRAPFIDTASQAVASAEQTRGPAIELLRQDLAQADDAEAAFVFGDFNEPSGRDWTQAAVDAGNQPIVVDWPSSQAVEDEGFTDAYREIHPDPVADTAFTWTPTSKPTDKWDHHDRIDFVFARGDGLTVEDASIVGESKANADIVVTPWPSDHRAVAATVTF